MKNMILSAAACVTVTGLTSFAGAAINDTFDTIDSAWVTDRYNSNEFASVVDPTNSANNVLRIGISTADSAANRPPAYSNSFYNTQGKQRPAGSIGSTWVLSADLLITTDMLDTTPGSGLRRTDLWGRDSEPSESAATYPIFGITNASPTDGFNPSATDRSARFRVWDGDTSLGWVDITSVTPTTGWHNLAITYDGSEITYSIDGTDVYTDTTVSSGAAGYLQTVFLQAYNFGDSNYVVHWDNLIAAVPEPATLGVFGLGGLLLGRRRR